LLLKTFKIIEWNWFLILIPFFLVGFIQVIISDTLLGIKIIEIIKRKSTTPP